MCNDDKYDMYGDDDLSNVGVCLFVQNLYKSIQPKTFPQGLGADSTKDEVSSPIPMN